MISQSVVCIYMHVANVPAFLTEIFTKTSSWGPKTQKSLFSLLIFFFKNVHGGSETHAIFFGGGADFGVFGAHHAPTRGTRGVGKRYTSSYDHDLRPV